MTLGTATLGSGEVVYRRGRDEVHLAVHGGFVEVRVSGPVASGETVTCVIPGTRNPTHVADNLAAATGPLPDEINYTAGFDWALSPRLTFVVDALGRTLRNSQVLREIDTTFEYNVNPATDPVDPRMLGESVGEAETRLRGSGGATPDPAPLQPPALSCHT